MPGNGDLIRSMRAGGGAGLAAAQELLRRARSGAVNRAELAQVKQVIAASPELKDLFKGVSQEVSALLDPHGAQVLRDVDQLAPDHARLTDARALPDRFVSDLQLVKGQLLGHPGLTRAQKAERLFAFFEGYAQRFGELAHGVAQAKAAATAEAPPLAEPLSSAELERALTQFERALRHAGFADVRAADGHTGLEHALRLLERDGREPLPPRPPGLDAPSWKDNAPEPRSLQAEVERERRGVYELDARGPHLPTQLQGTQEAPRSGRPGETPEPEPTTPRAARRGADGVLGSKMLWNVLHLLRGEELDDVARRDALNALVVSAVLLLTLGAIVAVVLALT